LRDAAFHDGGSGQRQIDWVLSASLIQCESARSAIALYLVVYIGKTSYPMVGQYGWEMPERSFSAERAAVIFIIALFAILTSVLSLSLYQSYQAAVLRINERVMTSSQIVATNAGWIDALAWQALRRVDDRLGPEIKAGAISGVEDIKDAVYGLPGHVQAYVVNADGLTLYSTDPQVKPIDIRDREYFSALAKGASHYISPILVSRSSSTAAACNAATRSPARR
jgi:hypothetical protein